MGKLVMRRSGRRPPPLSEEDKTLWAYATADVVRKKTDSTACQDASQDQDETPPQAPPAPKAPAPKRSQAAAPLPQKPRTKPALPPLQADRPGPTPGLDRRTEERFRRGQMSIDGRLDLHGMTQEQAHAALRRFILHAFERGARKVLVITGKGQRGSQEQGVLRRALPHWLNDPSLRQCILSFTTARPNHGGSGAFYVLLKRRRQRDG